MILEDNKWEEFNRSLLEETKRKNWGLYRNVRFEMAEFLKKERKFINALETYLEVLYLDQNGPDNCESIKDDLELLREYPPFDPSMAFVAPGVIGRVKILIKKLNIDINKVQEIFIQHNQRIQNNLKTPVSPEKAWGEIRSILNSINLTK